MEKKSGYHYGVLQIQLGLNCIALNIGAGVLADYSCGMEKNSGYHYGVLQIPLGLNCIALHMGAGVLVDCVWKLQRRKQMRPIVCLLLGCLLFMKVPGWHSPDTLTN